MKFGYFRRHSFIVLAMSLGAWVSTSAAFACQEVALIKESCYTREYSDEHMRKNPSQTVAEIKLILFEYAPDGEYYCYNEARFNGGLSVKFKDQSRKYFSGFYCDEFGDDERKCSLFNFALPEYGGGKFTIDRLSNDKLTISSSDVRLVNPETRLVRTMIDNGASQTSFALTRQKDLSSCDNAFILFGQ